MRSFRIICAECSAPAAFVGETHAMRIDIGGDAKLATVYQAHESFRRCVGQSSAEFCLDALAHPRPGVHLPEDLYQLEEDRRRIILQLTSTPGTTAFRCFVRDAGMNAPFDVGISST